MWPLLPERPVASNVQHVVDTFGDNMLMHGLVSLQIDDENLSPAGSPVRRMLDRVIGLPNVFINLGLVLLAEWLVANSADGSCSYRWSASHS